MGQLSAKPIIINCNQKVVFEGYQKSTSDYSQIDNTKTYSFSYKKFSYKGKLNEKMEAEGNGKCTYSCGCSYEGEWKEGLMHGIGTLYVFGCLCVNNLNYNFLSKKSSSTRKYKGSFKNGLIDGPCTFSYKTYIHPDDDFPDDCDLKIPEKFRLVYAGEAKNGFPDGVGFYYYVSDALYQKIYGHNKKFYFSGECVVHYRNGFIYTGYLTNDKICKGGKFSSTIEDLAKIKIEEGYGYSFNEIKCEADLIWTSQPCKFSGTIRNTKDHLYFKGTFSYEDGTVIKSELRTGKDAGAYQNDYEATYFIEEKKRTDASIKYEKGTYENGKKEGGFITRFYNGNLVFLTYSKGLLKDAYCIENAKDTKETEAKKD